MATQNDDYAIDVSKVNKHFGHVKALVDVDLQASRGKVTGLLGPNGAGKSTLIRVMTTLLEPSSGQVLVDDVNVLKNPAKARNRIGLAGQFAAVDDFLTGRETLEMVARLYHLSKKESKKRARYESVHAMELFYKKHYIDKYPFFINWPVLMSLKFLEALRVSMI